MTHLGVEIGHFGDFEGPGSRPSSGERVLFDVKMTIWERWSKMGQNGHPKMTDFGTLVKTPVFHENGSKCRSEKPLFHA